jgi:hypothetical protein
VEVGGGGEDTCLRGRKRFEDNVILLWVMLFCKNLGWICGFGY